MKKIMISLLMVAAATTTSFAKSNYTIEKKDGGISFMGINLVDLFVRDGI